ncbi:MAG TPA: helix-turn-helix domain-containing protein [Tepidisphaeraceae bacterium]|nr:helix-turn-helix domain-containing protein [Tepidisphaeraceae bacterium]
MPESTPIDLRPIAPILVSRRDAAKLLSVSERTLADWQDVPVTRIGGRVLYSVAALRRFVRENTVTASTE